MAREWLAAQDTSNVVLERVPPGRRSKTGFVQVIKVGDYFQPRLQIKGEGRGGVRKRAQYPLPTFTTPHLSHPAAHSPTVTTVTWFEQTYCDLRAEEILGYSVEG